MIDSPEPATPRIVSWLELLASVDFMSFQDDGDQVNPARDERRRKMYAEFAIGVRSIDPTATVEALPETLPSPSEVIEMCKARGWMKPANEP